jgi:hypothetical protein
MSDEIPKESKEYVTLGYRKDGTIPTAGVQAVMLPRGTRPQEPDWVNAEFVDDDWRILVGTGQPTSPTWEFGDYDIWARLETDPEKTVRVARRAIRII